MIRDYPRLALVPGGLRVAGNPGAVARLAETPEGSEDGKEGIMVMKRKQVRLVSRAPEARPLSALPEVAALGYRPCPVKGYLFLYRVRGDRVEIAHVFHQSQDYARHL